MQYAAFPPSSAAGLLRERPGSTGMLVVESVVPGGPADGQLEPGDVLVGGQGGASFGTVLRQYHLVHCDLRTVCGRSVCDQRTRRKAVSS